MKSFFIMTGIALIVVLAGFLYSAIASRYLRSCFKIIGSAKKS